MPTHPRSTSQNVCKRNSSSSTKTIVRKVNQSIIQNPFWNGGDGLDNSSSPGLPGLTFAMDPESDSQFMIWPSWAYKALVILQLSVLFFCCLLHCSQLNRHYHPDPTGPDWRGLWDSRSFTRFSLQLAWLHLMSMVTDLEGWKLIYPRSWWGLAWCAVYSDAESCVPVSGCNLGSLDVGIVMTIDQWG